MTTDPFNICPSCAHVATCVLTELKEKVWSCSDYDEARPAPQETVRLAPQFELV